MKQYWEERKVYLYVQLAFLPKAIEGKALRAAKLRHYFDTDNLEAELQEYARGGYFKTQALGSDTFRLTDIDSQKFRDGLDKYIKDYRAGKLTTGGAAKPNFKSEQTQLRGAAAKQYEQHAYRPIIRWQDIYNTTVGYGYSPRFWELILTPVVAGQAELINIGYTKTTADVPAAMLPLYEKPYAELEIIDEEFKRVVASQPTQSTKRAVSGGAAPSPTPALSTPHSITTRSYDANSGTLFFGGHEIQIIRQKNRRGKAVGETTQGALMRKLFKDVNTLHNGLPLHTVISVRKDNLDKEKRKRVINHLAEINRKIEKETGIAKLIIHDQVNYYIDKSYLV